MSFDELGLLRYLDMYKQHHTAKFGSVDALVLSVDGSRDSLKVTCYFNSANYTNRPIILVCTKVRESKCTTRDAIFFAHVEVQIHIDSL